MEIPDVDRIMGEAEEGIRKRVHLAMKRAGGVREKDAVFRAVNGYLSTIEEGPWGDFPPPAVRDVDLRETEDGYHVGFRLRFRWWMLPWAVAHALWSAIRLAILEEREIEKTGRAFDEACRKAEERERDC